MGHLNTRDDKREYQHLSHNRKAGSAKYWKDYGHRKSRRNGNRISKEIVEDINKRKMILSDISIKHAVKRYNLIEPFQNKLLQPASYDLILGELPSLFPDMFIQPKEFILASTLEKVHMPSHLVGRIEGKSTLARQGLIIHTAGFVDPGFEGQLTLEITNLSNEPIYLRVGQKIAQIAFQQLDKPAAKPYGHPDLESHYQGQEGITKAK